MSTSRHGAFRHVVAFALTIALLPGCAKLNPPRLEPAEDPFDVIHIARYGTVDPATREVRMMPPRTHRARWFFLDRRVAQRPLPPQVPGKIDTALVAMMARLGAMASSTDVPVLITYRDTLTIPRFPTLGPGSARGQGSPKDSTALDTAMALATNLRTARNYGPDTTLLAANFGATQIRTYWLIRAVSCVMPVTKANQLDTVPNIAYVRLDIGPEAPHHDSERTNDMDQAITALGTQSYYGLGSDGYIALLDSGVRTTHRLLWNPATLCMVADVVNHVGTGVPNDKCSPFNPDGSTAGGGDTYFEGHGTSSAAILVGNGAMPPPVSNTAPTQTWFRGVTKASLDCFTVYEGRHLRPSAAVRAFELARERLDFVIVAEMQDVGPEVDGVAMVADQAYQNGAVVIAANGNDDADGTGVPARGRRVLGIGAYHLQFGQDVKGMSFGSTDDGRPKPDLLAPSYTETAGNNVPANANDPTQTTDSEEVMQYHKATSGATPYAAGAALLLRNWMIANTENPTNDPGQIYSMMILAGDELGSFRSDSRRGAGRIHLPPRGTAQYGKTWVSAGSFPVEVPIEIKAADNVKRLKAALWWPETTPVPGGRRDTHNDIDLELVSPTGQVMAKSNGGAGVFERTQVTSTTPLSGKWILRVRCFAQATPESQVVYWAASLEP